MSVGLKFMPMVRAVRAGLVECLDPLNVSVFPGDPEGSYDRNGSAWVASVKDAPEIDQLGADEDDHDEEVTITVTVSAYAESAESHMKAHELAEDRVAEMLDAYRNWIAENPTLDGTCDWLKLGNVEPRTAKANSGWVFEVDLPIVATAYPSSI